MMSEQRLHRNKASLTCDFPLIIVSLKHLLVMKGKINCHFNFILYSPWRQKNRLLTWEFTVIHSEGRQNKSVPVSISLTPQNQQQLTQTLTQQRVPGLLQRIRGFPPFSFTHSGCSSSQAERRSCAFHRWMMMIISG